MIQKSEPAPKERKQNKASGEISRLLVKSLQTMMLMPKMAYAMKHARCPRGFSFMRVFYFFLLILPSRFSLKSSDLLRHTNPLLCGTHRHLPYTRISATVARFPRKNLLTISCFSWSRRRSRPMMPKADVFLTMYPSTTLPHFLHLNFCE